MEEPFDKFYTFLASVSVGFLLFGKQLCLKLAPTLACYFIIPGQQLYKPVSLLPAGVLPDSASRRCYTVMAKQAKERKKCCFLFVSGFCWYDSSDAALPWQLAVDFKGAAGSGFHFLPKLSKPVSWSLCGNPRPGHLAFLHLDSVVICITPCRSLCPSLSPAIRDNQTVSCRLLDKVSQLPFCLFTCPVLG